VSEAQSAKERCASTLVLAFSIDPICRWVWPDPYVYLSAMPRFIAAFGGRALETGTGFIADGGRAAALWLPPGVEPDHEAMGAIINETLQPEISANVGGLLEGMAEYHPHEAHWYLPLIGTDPRWMGQGFGSALMEHALQKCDQDGVAAYLESTNPRNISLYQRHGFEIMGEVRSGTCPVLTPMLRPAR
jgi:ribosomal protein S18 acetylase RimI-like enzyme